MTNRFRGRRASESIAVLWFQKVMHLTGQMFLAIFLPLFATDGPVTTDAIPAWTLSAACSLFLSAMAWAIRYVVVHGSAALKTMYTEVVLPASRAHIDLMETLKSTREQDSASLKSLASTQDVILEELKTLSDSKEP